MKTEIVIAIISGLCVAIPSIIANVSANKRSNDLVLYRIEELSKKVHEHNQLIDRMYKVEERVTILEEKEGKWCQIGVYDVLKFCGLIIVPVVNFIFLILTTTGKMDSGIATPIIGGLDVLIGAIVTSANEVWKRKQDTIILGDGKEG